MNSPATLRTETGARCLDIERLEQQLKTKTIAFDTGRELWDSAYRPKARILAEAMLPYVPTGDPRIHVEFEAGDFRKIKSDAVNCICGGQIISQAAQLFHDSTEMGDRRSFSFVHFRVLLWLHEKGTHRCLR
jgi:hypothetical protein